MDSIHKTFFGRFIDLSQLVSVSEAQFSGYRWIRVGFEMDFKFMEKPIVFERILTDDEYRNDKDRVRLVDGSWVVASNTIDDHTKVLAVQNLQTQINEIVQAWMDYKKITGE
jgi:hypothetical protein